MSSRGDRHYSLSVSDASVIYPVIQARLLEASEYAQTMGISPLKIPYVQHLQKVASSLQEFLQGSSL